MLKQDLTPAGKDLTTHVLHDPVQHIRSDMRLCITGDLLRCTKGMEGLQDKGLGAVPVFIPGIQLAVGEGSCTTLSKGNIAFRIQASAFPEPVHILLSLFHRDY